MTAQAEVRALVKRYEGVQALRAIDLAIERGEIHALVGENGAGKSTLGKVLAGAVIPDKGEILVGGAPVRFRSPRDALAAGVALVHQEIALIQSMSVLENVFMGAEPTGVLRRPILRSRLRKLMDDTGLRLPNVDALVSTLRVAEQQKVEILRALVRGADLIVMDEPTAPLSADESERLYALIRGLRDRGTTIVYISHYLEEVLALADTVSILKDGDLVRTSPAAEETPETLISGMLGRSLEATFPEKKPPADDAPIVLAVAGLSKEGAFEDVSFEIRKGEILALAGLVGSGRTEVARALFGADKIDRGTIELLGRPLRIRSPRSAIARRVALLPESRKDQGLLMTRPVRENLTLPHLGMLARSGFIRRRPERVEATAAIRRVDIRAPSGEVPVATLSGGNQQKVMFGKWLLNPPLVLIADEPTRGVDVGAKRAIYDLISSLAAEGMTVLLISSELEEVMGLAHRIVVMYRGRLVAELHGEASEDEILAAAFGKPRGEAVA